jgi:hypothetical protein
LAKVLDVENVGDGSFPFEDDGEVGLAQACPGGASPGATKRNAGAALSWIVETRSGEGRAGEFCV